MEISPHGALVDIDEKGPTYIAGLPTKDPEGTDCPAGSKRVQEEDCLNAARKVFPDKTIDSVKAGSWSDRPPYCSFSGFDDAAYFNKKGSGENNGKFAAVCEATSGSGGLPSAGDGEDGGTVSDRPAVTGFEEAGCGGKKLGGFTLPHGADMTGDHCLAVRSVDTGAPGGRVKFSCSSDGTARACVYHPANDTSCDMTEPFCLNFAPEVVGDVAQGKCVPAVESPIERQTYVTFSNFREDSKWPPCLIPPMSMMDLAMYGGGGVFCALIVNCIIWQACLAKPSKHQDFGEEGFEDHGFRPSGFGEGEKGMMGKGFGGKY